MITVRLSAPHAAEQPLSSPVVKVTNPKKQKKQKEVAGWRDWGGGEKRRRKRRPHLEPFEIVMARMRHRWIENNKLQPRVESKINE